MPAQSKDIDQKVVQTAAQESPSRVPSASYIPDNAWVIAAVGLCVFLVLLGLRVYRSKTLKIDTAKVDIECDEESKAPEAPKSPTA